VLESGQYVMGPMLKKFEAELAAYHGTRFAVGWETELTPSGLR
jgi:dTDP-4-amino-4,6-dideoxygalactose transaminase